MRFEGTTVIITGAAGGLGSAMAASFAAGGGLVAMVDLPGSRGDLVAAQINESHLVGSAFFVPCDLADLNGTGEVMRCWSGRWGARAGEQCRDLPEQAGR